MMRIFFMSTLLKAGAHYRLSVRAAFFPVFSETLLILNPPCQHVFVRSRTNSVRQSPLADGAGNPDIGVPKFQQEFCGGQWHRLQPACRTGRPVWFRIVLGADKNAQTEVCATKSDSALRLNCFAES